MKHFDQSSITFALLGFKIKHTTIAGGLRYALSVCSVLLTIIASAQKPLYHIRAGDTAASQARWDLAFSHYNEAYSMDTSDFEVTVKLADAARQVKEYELALKLYQNTYTKDNGKLNPDGLYHIAMLQKLFGEYEDCQRNLKKYLKKHKSSGSKSLIQRAEHEVKAAIWALNYKDGQDEIQLERLNTEVNSPQSELCNFSGSEGYYSTTFPNSRWKIMQTDAQFQSKGKVIEMDSMLEGDELANLFLLNEQVLFSLKRDGRTEIYTAIHKDEKLTAVRNLNALNETGVVNTMATIGTLQGERFIFWVSDRPGGEGGMDIWKAKWTMDGTISGIQNAGKSINTPGDELYPLLIGGELFFSSDWHEGFGGLDIFYSTFNNGQFGKPVNMGRPINSSWNDLGYIKNAQTNTAYLASNRPQENADTKQTCCNDLYAVKLPVKSDELVESALPKTLAELQKVLPVVLYFHNDEPNPRTTDTTTTISYSEAYDAYLKLIPTYISENAKGLSGNRKEEAELRTQDFFDLNVKKGMSDLELFSDLLLKELEAGNGVKIIVRGFASPRANSDYNLHLTKRRTASLVNYLRAIKGGAFVPYLSNQSANGARLIVEQLPFGEYKAAKGVSDDLRDVKSSIYSRSASLERKIEIESVSMVTAQSNLRLPSTEHDFGKIGRYEKVYHTFLLENTGKNILLIDSAVASCGCTEPKLPKLTIAPGEVLPMEVSFDPFGKKGKDTKSVMLYIQGEKPRKFWIRAEVEQ